MDDPHLKESHNEYVNSHFVFTDKVDIGSVRYAETDTFRGDLKKEELRCYIRISG